MVEGSGIGTTAIPRRFTTPSGAFQKTVYDPDVRSMLKMEAVSLWRSMGPPRDEACKLLYKGGLCRRVARSQVTWS